MPISVHPSVEELAALLRLPDFSEVYAQADRVRARHKGDVVQIRAILEFSNVCRRTCGTAGLTPAMKRLPAIGWSPTR